MVGNKQYIRKLDEMLMTSRKNGYSVEEVINYITRRYCVDFDKNAPKDKLTEMFEHQLQLQVRLGSFKKIEDDITRQHFIDRMLLACHEELVEIQKETLSKDRCMPFGWKLCSFSETKYKEEIIDLWHFTMNLWLAVGGTPQEFFELYCEKNKINHERQDNRGKY